MEGQRLGCKRVVKLNSEQWEFGKSQLREAIYIEAARYKIDPDLVFALVWQESRWNLRAVSPKKREGAVAIDAWNGGEIWSTRSA